MRYGTPITLCHDGFLIGPESLAPVGIGDRSTCWGTWVPNRNFEPDPTNLNHLPHFFVSPFEPHSWPILFRIEVAIDGDNPLALANAISPITGEGMSILSIDVTQAGHRHFWATIIAEAIKFKAPGGIIDKLKRLPERRRSFRDPKTWISVHSELAPEMLKKSERVVAAVERYNKEKKFLRSIFLEPMDPDTGMINDEFEKGVLYDWAELPESVRAVGRAQRTPAVHCSWMQNLAFFWLYRRTEPMKLEYNEQLRKIKVTSEQVTKFKAMMREFPSSSRFISFIDLQERFLRVVLSPDDLRNSTARVTIPFHAKYGIYEGSKGFQQKLFHDLVSTTRLKIRHVSMSTYYRDLDEEDGTLSLLVSSINGPHRLPSLTKLRTTIQQVADDAAASLAGQGCVMDCSGVTVQQFSSPLVFLSTRFDWIEGPSSSRIDQIKRLGESAGLNVITGDTGSRRSLEEFVPTIRDKNSITDVISELIRHCSAFIQIIPIDVLRGWKGVSTRGDEGTLNWLLFEFGAAQALRLPCEILVDVRNAEADIGGWQRVLKVGT